MGNNILKNPGRIILILFFALMVNRSTAVTATVQGALPSVLVESSGVDWNGSASFWSLNDSWGDNHLYKFSNTGALTQTITIDGAANRNWEDLTHDANRDYMFIGDFGNNNCDRTNLRVFRIPYPHSGITSATAEEIDFTLNDQTDFPSPWMNFDIEAFFHFNGRLYLFTKADGSAVGYTKMYSLSENPGTHVATLVDSFYTNDRTTSAAISPDGSAMVLISNSHIHIFKNFVGNDFFSGQHTQLNISGSWTQKEAVTFTSNNEIYLTDENTGSGNNLYYLSLASYIPASTTAIGEVESTSVSVYPNPATDFIKFNFNKQFKSVSIQLFDITGKIVNMSSFENVKDAMIDLNKFSPGIYIYKIFTEGNLQKTERLIVK